MVGPPGSDRSPAASRYFLRFVLSPPSSRHHTLRGSHYLTPTPLTRPWGPPPTRRDPVPTPLLRPPSTLSGSARLTGPESRSPNNHSLHWFYSRSRDHPGRLVPRQGLWSRSFSSSTPLLRLRSNPVLLSSSSEEKRTIEVRLRRERLTQWDRWDCTWCPGSGTLVRVGTGKDGGKVELKSLTRDSDTGDLIPGVRVQPSSCPTGPTGVGGPPVHETHGLPVTLPTVVKVTRGPRIVGVVLVVPFPSPVPLFYPGNPRLYLGLV